MLCIRIIRIIVLMGIDMYLVYKVLVRLAHFLGFFVDTLKNHCKYYRYSNNISLPAVKQMYI